MSVTSLNIFNLSNYKPIPYSEYSPNLDIRKNNSYVSPTISIIGFGRTGTVTSAFFSKMGVPVIVVDIDKKNILEINSGHSHFYEDGLDSAIQSDVKGNTLSATDNILSAIVKNNITTVTVSIFKDKNGNYDLAYLIDACKRIGLALQRKNTFYTIIFISIVAPDTTDKNTAFY